MGSVQPGMMSEGQMWELAVLRRQELWHPESPRRARRGGAALLVLVGLASAGGACGIAGDVVSVGTCAHFVATVRTSEPSYAPGQTVIITVSQANDGPGCVTPPRPCGDPAAFASAYNSAGEDVWDYDAGKTIPGIASCPPEFAPGQPLPGVHSRGCRLPTGVVMAPTMAGPWLMAVSR
jgi:hypothetical protein